MKAACFIIYIGRSVGYDYASIYEQRIRIADAGVPLIEAS
jgi:hypothetical protein